MRSLVPIFFEEIGLLFMSYFSGFMRQIQICRQESHFLGLYKPPRAFSIARSGPGGHSLDVLDLSGKKSKGGVSCRLTIERCVSRTSSAS